LNVSDAINPPSRFAYPLQSALGASYHLGDVNSPQAQYTMPNRNSRTKLCAIQTWHLEQEHDGASLI